MYERCGLEYVKKRFKVSWLTIYLWKKKLREDGIIGLKNKTRAPINKRKSKIEEEVKEYIKYYRTKYIVVSKEVIYPQLKQYLHLHWYNFTNVRKGLNYITPIDFINKNLIN